MGHKPTRLVSGILQGEIQIFIAAKSGDFIASVCLSCLVQADVNKADIVLVADAFTRYNVIDALTLQTDICRIGLCPPPDGSQDAF